MATISMPPNKDERAPGGSANRLALPLTPAARQALARVYDLLLRERPHATEGLAGESAGRQS